MVVFLNLKSESNNSTYLLVLLQISNGIKSLVPGCSVSVGFCVFFSKYWALLGTTHSVALASRSLCWGLAHRMPEIQGWLQHVLPPRSSWWVMVQKANSRYLQSVNWDEGSHQARSSSGSKVWMLDPCQAPSWDSRTLLQFGGGSMINHHVGWHQWLSSSLSSKVYYDRVSSSSI